MMARPARSCPVTIRRNRLATECLRNPICDIAAAERHVVYADVLHATGPFVEQLELAFRAVDQLIIGAMGILDGYLPVLRPVRHQERHADTIQNAIQINLRGNFHELGHVPSTPHPPYMLPVVWDRPIPFACHPPLLDFTPVVVGSPTDSEREAALECNRPWRVIPAQGYTYHSYTARIDIRPAFQNINHLRSPALSVKGGSQSVD